MTDWAGDRRGPRLQRPVLLPGCGPRRRSGRDHRGRRQDRGEARRQPRRIRAERQVGRDLGALACSRGGETGLSAGPGPDRRDTLLGRAVGGADLWARGDADPWRYVSRWRCPATQPWGLAGRLDASSRRTGRGGAGRGTGRGPRGEAVLILGGGTNLVVPDEGFPGTVVQVPTRGVRVLSAATPRCDSSCGRGLGRARHAQRDGRFPGVECLSGFLAWSEPPPSRTSAPTARRWPRPS